jgi:prolyl-tRNA editing enzyme YbaK/EbsC (Cys-tRNA(Pro) deacylase)
MTIVTQYLREHGIRFETLRHAPVQTALGEAFSLGVPPEQVVKTIVLDIGRTHVLALIPATGRLDKRLLKEALRASRVHLATEDELGHLYPRFEPGTLPPLGSLLSARVFIDPEVVKQPTVVFAAGSTEQSVRVSTRDLLRLERAIVVPLVREAEPARPTAGVDGARERWLLTKRANSGLSADEARELGYLRAQQERHRSQAADPMARRSFQADRFIEQRTKERERGIRIR